MKRLVAIFSLTFLLVAVVVPVAFAQQQDDRIIVKKSDLPPEVLKQVETKQKIETYGGWVGLGREVGQAVNEGLQALTKNADEFSKTGVGKFTMFLIAWKIMGTDLLQLLFGSLFFLVGLGFFSWSWYLNGRTRKVNIGTKTEPRYEIIKPSDDAQLVYGIWFVVHVIVTVLIVFV